MASHKNVSRLPLPKNTVGKGEKDTENSSRPSSGASVNLLSERIDSQRSNRQPKLKAKDKPKPVPSQQINAHPLSKAMQKKQKNLQSKDRQSETYADEKITSVSSKLRGAAQDENKRRKEEIQKQLKEAEAQLVVMRSLIDQRDQMLQDASQDAAEKAEAYKEKISDQENKLIQNAIDPVTGEKIEQSEEEKDKVEVTKKFTKKRVQEMREKLRQMNTQTETFLADIENTVTYLGSLAESSERAGPLSPRLQAQVDEVGPDDFIAKVYAENVPPPRQKQDSAEEDDSEEEDRKEVDEPPTQREAPSGRESEEKDVVSASKEAEEEEDVAASKVFLTSRVETSNLNDLLPGDD